jgi:hypothetical protein
VNNKERMDQQETDSMFATPPTSPGLKMSSDDNAAPSPAFSSSSSSSSSSSYGSPYGNGFRRGSSSGSISNVNEGEGRRSRSGSIVDGVGSPKLDTLKPVVYPKAFTL